MAQSPASSAIRLRSAVALIGRFPALAGVDLDVERAEIVLLRGANGAGKTTILRACAGLVPVVSGEAVVLGHDLRLDRRTVRRHLGFFGHSTALYEDLTVAENVRFAARAAGASTGPVDPTIERLGLTGRVRDTPVARLSAGQRRRTSLCCLLVRPADLWLLDEPHAGLDAASRDQLDELLHGAAAAGTTVVLASHELDRTESLATRHVTVAGGQVHEEHATQATAGPAGAEPTSDAGRPTAPTTAAAAQDPVSVA